MGKAKPRHKSKRKQSSYRPTGLPSVKDTDKDVELQSNDCELYINVVEEIQSPDIETRLCGLRTLATLAERPESVDDILDHKVIKIIAPFLVEKNSEVRNLTAGVLRNLSACGSAEANARLVADDVMTPLLAVWAQYDVEWKPQTSTAEDSDTLLQLTNVLWNLCETDETALRYFNSSNVLSLLLRCLDHDAVGIDLAIAACQCLNVVSEDNPNMASALRSREGDLLRLLSEPATTYRKLLFTTLVAAIVCNVSPGRGWLPAVLAAIDAALAVDSRSSVCRLSSDLPSPDRPLSADCEARLVEMVALVEAQTVALETLANLVSVADDDMDVESGSEEDDEWEGEENGGSGETGQAQSLALDTEVSEALARHELLEAVVKRAEAGPLPHNVTDILNLNTCPSASRRLANKCASLQCRALLCLNNLVSAGGGLPLADLGGAARLYQAAGLITARCLAHPPTTATAQDVELLEASTAAVRAIVLRLALEKFTGVTDVKPEHLQVLFDVGGRTDDARVRANVARTVATIGTMLLTIGDHNSQPLVQMIGAHLLDTVECEAAGRVWLACEALDCLVDLFADDLTDLPAARLRLVERLRAITPRLKDKVRRERKTLGEHSVTVSTVMANLGPFVKYKAERVAAIVQTTQ